jgi:hypothetical protein
MWMTGKEPGSSVVAHEWGTFTSVAMDTGAPARWAPWSGPADLPCFVHRDSQRRKFELSGLVRMETPVIYFYSDKPATVSVDVDFPKGLVTEWYPQASKIRSAQVTAIAPAPISPEHGGISWNSVQLIPGNSPTPPSGKPNHYFAARNTDATPLRVQDEDEKLLFYRGVGNFVVPLRVRYPGDGTLEIRNLGPDTIPVAIAFENQGGKIGYRVVRDLKGEVSIEPPALTADGTKLRSELARELIAAGLYEKEAAAMIDTWRDSWFEEGSRVFYVVPRAEVDRVLPLQIQPAPAQIARVFVGRVEVLSPYTERTVAEANRTADVATLKRFGRFLEPFAAQMKLAGSPALIAAQRELAIDYASATCVR